MAKAAQELPTWMVQTARQKNSKDPIKPQPFDYYLALDFEATCDKDILINPQEIIEFPCLKINAKNFQVESQFHRYIRPTSNPDLTVFCTELTGITQDMVADQAAFREVFSDFKDWIKSEELEGKQFTFVTCGDWDLKTMLPRQCQSLDLPVPPYFQSWINLKKSYNRVMRKYPRHLDEMVRGVGLTFEGRPHSGIDDTKNIHRVLRGLALKGGVFEVTARARVESFEMQK